MFDEGDEISPQALTLIAIAHLAEHLNNSQAVTGNHANWDAVRDQVLEHLGLLDEEYENLKEEIAEMMV